MQDSEARQAERARRALESVLEQQARCTGLLLESLQSERAALTQRDLDALEQSTRAKLEQTEKLEQLEQQRARLLEELGFDTSADSLQRCFRSLPQPEALFRLWQQVVANTEACQAGNLSNGGIVESARQHVERALGILRGQSGGPSLYDPNGDASASLGQRELGKV